MSERSHLYTGLAAATLLLSACGDELINRPPQSDTGFSTEGPDDAGAFDGDDGDDGDVDPEAGDSLCDAGDEAWVKRAIPFIQGRKPNSIREVRTLVSAIEQLDEGGLDGRRMVARALAHGDLYLERWKTYLYEHLRVQRAGDRLNSFCYDRRTDHWLNETLAAGVRDNPPGEVVGNQADPPTIADLTYSALRLDDVTPLYRADLFARMWAPLTGGNTTREELEVANRSLFGGLFESVYLGRNTECLQCHISTASTTYDSDPSRNRHWAVHPDIEIERSVYGWFEYGQETRDLEDVHAIFRHAGVVDYSWCAPLDNGCAAENIGTTPGETIWGMAPGCGLFRDDNFDDPEVDLEDAIPYMAGEFGAGSNATLFALEGRLRRGFNSLANSGLTASDGMPEDPEAAMAFLFSMNFAEGIWKEAMGHPLTVANKFPRNAAQQETLQLLTETFYANQYSLRELILEVATHEYFNQAAPDTCGVGTAYPMPAIFDPFTRDAEAPDQRGNGVGDMLHRYSAPVLLDSMSYALWWPRFNRFGEQTSAAFLATFLDVTLDELDMGLGVGNGNITQLNPVTGTNLACCGAGYCPPCNDGPRNIPFQRDIGLHISQFDAGFNGTDFNGILHWEQEIGSGGNPGLSNLDAECTGPLGGTCSSSDYVSRLVGAAGSGTMRDVAVALKDRLITEPSIGGAAEEAAIAGIMGESLDTPVAEASDATASARRYAGVLLNSPQFMLDGIVSPDQPPEQDPTIIVPGTDTLTSCQYFADLTGETPEWGGLSVTCSQAGISIQ